MREPDNTPAVVHKKLFKSIQIGIVLQLYIEVSLSSEVKHDAE